MSTELPIRVMLVDDHPLIRDGIRPYVEHDGTALIVAEAGDGSEAIEKALEVKPDVILMDLEMPKMGGVEATRRIIQELPNTKVLVFSSSGDEPDVMEAVKAGAGGYLLKEARAAEVAEAIRQVHHGQLAFSPSLAAMILQEFRRSPSQSKGQKEQTLTETERKVLELQQKGVNLVDIAKKMSISMPKLHNIIHSIRNKLQYGD